LTIVAEEAALISAIRAGQLANVGAHMIEASCRRKWIRTKVSKEPE
jgi:hypothetical protein